jgi:hypothetical protein
VVPTNARSTERPLQRALIVGHDEPSPLPAALSRFEWVGCRVGLNRSKIWPRKYRVFTRRDPHPQSPRHSFAFIYESGGSSLRCGQEAASEEELEEKLAAPVEPFTRRGTKQAALIALGGNSPPD